MTNQITILSDVHGKKRRLNEVIRQTKRHEYIVQLGDLDFNYDHLNSVDPNNFKVIGGNHDNYDTIANMPHYLGDFGYSSLNGIDFFFIRGAYSIDRAYRTVGINWWDKEQLTIDQFDECFKLYAEIKPDIIISHDCPEFLTRELIPLGAPVYHNCTSWALGEIYKIHQPKQWFFGHYHISWENQVGNTLFKCLNELETYILKKDNCS